ncbi:Endoplasmic reticulum metallopeptidase 1 (Felix-ina) [Durusdinium trenchii]|uniref:Endoplasmic reticulum metallopeptidase 1 (Felix-ina) n=1 Tax=Durusdinium trenchii TaxID=1381693 RepID=A0ABP0J0U1_9DINO
MSAFTKSSQHHGWLALLAFTGVVAFVLQEQWAVPEVQPVSATGFSAERARPILVDLVACGAKYVGFKGNELCAVEALRKEISRTLSEEAYGSGVSIDQQAASGHYYLDFIGGLTIVYRNLTNLLVKVPGTSPSKDSCTLLISSHFDSALGSPAASDANAT